MQNTPLKKENNIESMAQITENQPFYPGPALAGARSNAKPRCGAP